MYLDAHCHLERETYGDDLEGVIKRARDAGLTEMIAVGATRGLLGAREAVALAQTRDDLYATAGIHPHDAQEASEAAVLEVEALLSQPRVVALGEVGLDYYYDNSPRDMQRAVFRRFLAMAKDHNVPVMLHIRDAHAECLDLLDDVGLPERGGVVHCFSAGPREAEAYLERGMYLSIPGIVTFKKAEALREAVALIPDGRLLIETDAPYLAPVPYRGKRNEPAYLVHTAAAVGEVRGVSGAHIGQLTRRNAIALFHLPDRGAESPTNTP